MSSHVYGTQRRPVRSITTMNELCSKNLVSESSKERKIINITSKKDSEEIIENINQCSSGVYRILCPTRDTLH